MLCVHTVHIHNRSGCDKVKLPLECVLICDLDYSDNVLMFNIPNRAVWQTCERIA